MRAPNKKLTPPVMTDKERCARIERLLFKSGVALRRLWKTEPPWDVEVPPLKPAELKLLGARMRAGLSTPRGLEATPDEIEQIEQFERRAIWFHKRLRKYGELLQPLYAEEETLARNQEQAAFHETKDIVTADPGNGLNESFQTMKRGFRRIVGRRRRGR
jgi:hypothetical protein